MALLRLLVQTILWVFLILHLTLLGCAENKTKTPEPLQKGAPAKVVIFDTDANNELDDQHALAYLLFNSDHFRTKAFTVNATYNGGSIEQQYEEADRILSLCQAKGLVSLFSGAQGNFREITDSLDSTNFDGQEAVDYLLNQTQKDSATIIAVGKLTNLALALKKDPGFATRTRIVWLGSNYPEPGEYNQDNDTVAMNYLLNSTIPFEMVTVRYGKPSGTDAVRATKTEINEKMPGLGPHIDTGIEGRHGGKFHNFGDYSVNLFAHIDYHGDPPSRALFDMVAVAILKNPSWGKKKVLPAPVLINNQWVERPSNPRTIAVWEDFDKSAILTDFYESMKNPALEKDYP